MVARSAAYVAADAAYAAYAAEAAADVRNDRILSEFAEDIVQILSDMLSAGWKLVVLVRNVEFSWRYVTRPRVNDGHKHVRPGDGDVCAGRFI